MEACQPTAKVAPQNLRMPACAIMLRFQNDAKWRAVLQVLIPWWKAAQIFIRWSLLGGWERLLTLVQKNCVTVSMTLLDGTNISAHQRGASSPQKKIRHRNVMSVMRWVVLGQFWNKGLRDHMRCRFVRCLLAGPWPSSRASLCHLAAEQAA